MAQPGWGAGVLIENSIEYYLFTCARCASQWTDSYEVSQEVDENGDVRSFYRQHGVPCETPVSGNVECPNCHATKAVRDPLYGIRPDFDPEAAGHALSVPRPRAATDVVPGPALQRAVRRTVGGTWRRFKFSALVTLDPAERPGRTYLSGAPGLMVRAPSAEQPTHHQYFPAVFSTDEDRPLRPGDKGLPVVISVPDDDASGYFRTGQHFIVWDGAEIGHGTVAHPLVLQLW
jgi:hypothetical protein